MNWLDFGHGRNSHCFKKSKKLSFTYKILKSKISMIFFGKFSVLYENEIKSFLVCFLSFTGLCWPICHAFTIKYVLHILIYLKDWLEVPIILILKSRLSRFPGPARFAGMRDGTGTGREICGNCGTGQRKKVSQKLKNKIFFCILILNVIKN